MRTTLDLDDQLLRKARRLAVDRRMTLTRVIEESLRRYLAPARRQGRFAERWVVVGSGPPPTVDIADRGRLYDALEGRPTRGTKK